MKSIYGIALIILAGLLISCASRPSARLDTVERQKLFFERALREIKNNSPVVKKHFDPPEAIISGSGYSSVEDITVKGELVVKGSKYTAIYNFADAVQDEGNRYRISFRIEDPVNGNTHNDFLYWTPAEEEAGLLLSFDDAYLETWSECFDLFDSYAAKVTFFVQGEFQSGDTGGDAGAFLPYTEKDLVQFCAEALGRGHCLGFHTANHLDLRKVSRETFYAETLEAAAVFFRNGIRFSALAYPFGFSEQWMRDVLALAFPVTRGYGTNIRFCHTSIGNNGYIVSTAIDNVIYPGDVKFKNDLFRILLAAKFTGNSVVPFTTHEISDGAEWGIGLKRLEYLLKTAGELKMKFYTYDDFSALFSLKR